MFLPIRQSSPLNDDEHVNVKVEALFFLKGGEAELGQPSGDFSEIVTGMVMEDDHLRQYQQLLFREMNGAIITL